jgi:hypothetical protein
LGPFDLASVRASARMASHCETAWLNAISASFAQR